MGKYLKENHTEMSLHSVHRLRFNRFIKNLQMNIQWALKRHRRNSAVISMSTLVSIQSTCLKYASKFHGLVKWSLHFTLTLTISLYIPLEAPAAPPLSFYSMPENAIKLQTVWKHSSRSVHLMIYSCCRHCIEKPFFESAHNLFWAIF